MFGFDFLETDGSYAVYEGKREYISGLLGSGDNNLKKQLKHAAKQYRRWGDRKNYNNVVDELIDSGRSRNAIRYEVLAQLYRHTLRQVHKSEYGLFLPIADLPDDAATVYEWLGTWRDYWTGKTTKTMSYDSYLTTSYLTNEEQAVLLRALSHKDVARLHTDEQTITDLSSLIPTIQAVQKRGNDLFVVHAGYVPRGLRLMEW